MALPRGLGTLAVRIARLLPDSVLMGVLPRRLAFAPASRFPAPDPGDAPVRLFIGPVNFAGQGWQWAHAATRELPEVSGVSMAYTTGSAYGFPVDQRVPASVYLMSRAWQSAQRAAVTSGFTHVIIEAGRSLFGDVYRQSVADQVRELRAAGLSVALLTHGSDMRVPDRHAKTHAHSPFAPGEWDLTPTLAVETSRNHALVAELDLPVFASTPGMLADVPDAVWMPVVVDPAVWAVASAPFSASGPPLVMHAPSSVTVKGTALIEPTVRRLVDEGVIRYERLEGVPSADVPAHVARADVVLDQFRLGDYGVAACEAMAAGRVVVGNVDEQVREAVLTATGRTLPVVQADPDSLESVLRGILADPGRYRTTAAEGPAFIADVHAGRLSAAALRGFLGLASIGPNAR